MAIHLYRFFELITETGTFHIQCEWFYPTELDLDNASTEQDNNTACCHITVTDFLEYYTCTITRDLLLHNFKEHEDAFKEQKSNILEAAFQGKPSYKNSRLQWNVSKGKENSQLKMQLQIVNDDVPLTVGSFDLDKAPQDQVRDLKRLWFEHLDLSSSTDIEINKTLKEHIADIEKTNREYRKKIESTKNSERQKRHVAIDKFLRLLNTKKQKIYQLQQQAKEQKHQLENLVEDSNQNLPIIEPSTSKRGRRKKQSTSQEIEQTEEKPTRKRRVNKGKQPLRNEYEDEYDSDYENKFKLEEEDFTIPRSFKERVKKKQRTNHNDE